MLGAGAVGLLTAAMLQVTGSSKIVIADIEPRRVDFATLHEFADVGFVMPKKRGSTIEENLTFAREAAALVVGAASRSTEVENGTAGQFDAVFECTGVEACLQTAIYVRLYSYYFNLFSCFLAVIIK